MSYPLKPSIAEVTVTAGVNAPSASNVAPPIIAGTISHFLIRLTSVNSEKYRLHDDYQPSMQSKHT